MHALLQWLLIASAGLHSADGTSCAPESVRPSTEVRDPVFAYLTGLVDGDLYGSIDSGDLQEAVARSGGSSKLPFRHLRVLSREVEDSGRTARIAASFQKPLALPIPYRILGYTPGRLRASEDVEFREWILGETLIGYADPEGRTLEVRLEDVHLFGVLEGSLWVDIDGWLDGLVGGKLDDTRITGLVLFRSDGQLWGMAVGYNRGWQGRSGLLSLKDDQIRFPSPPPMKAAAWKLRQILEGLEPTLRPDSIRARISRG